MVDYARPSSVTPSAHPEGWGEGVTEDGRTGGGRRTGVINDIPFSGPEGVRV